MSNDDKYAYPDGGNFGLTKRELFAAMAMQGLVANSKVASVIKQVSKDANVSTGKIIAAAATIQADALIEELAK